MVRRIAPFLTSPLLRSRIFSNVATKVRIDPSCIGTVRVGFVRAHYNNTNNGGINRTFDDIQYAADYSSNNNSIMMYPTPSSTIIVVAESRLYHELYNPSGIIALLSSTTRSFDIGATMRGIVTVMKMQLLKSLSRYIHDRF